MRDDTPAPSDETPANARSERPSAGAQPSNLRPDASQSRSEAVRPRQLTAMRIRVDMPESGPLISVDGLETTGSLADASVDQRTELADDIDGEHEAEPDFAPEPQIDETTNSPARANHHPVLQSLTLLLSMVVMLAIARYSVPSIVEEIRYSWHRGQLRAEYEMGSEGLQNVSLDSINQAYQMVTSAVGPSVVHIEVKRQATVTEKQMHRRLGVDMFSLSDQGSGVVVDPDGYILTNRHVIIDGEEISVTMSDGRRLPAQVIGTDTLTDLAVLKVNADRLMPILWGDSDKLRVGSPVWAVGSPFGLDRTITFGILSGKHRMVQAGERHGSHSNYQDFMQSDVAVNPGNSGGPLVDSKGTLVGINTAIVGETYQGVSFSIPSNLSREIYERIRETGRVQRGYLGVSLHEVPDDLLIGENTRVRGALIAAIANTGSPAGDAGIQTGDIVLRANGEDITDVGHLMRIVGTAAAGTKIQIDVRRADKDVELTVTLGHRPVDLDQP